MAESNDLLVSFEKILEQATSKEMEEIRLKILRKIASENDIKPSRIPPPTNITQIGGYINLLNKLGHDDLTKQMLSSVLGLPMQQPIE